MLALYLSLIYSPLGLVPHVPPMPKTAQCHFDVAQSDGSIRLVPSVTAPPSSMGRYTMKTTSTRGTNKSVSIAAGDFQLLPDRNSQTLGQLAFLDSDNLQLNVNLQVFFNDQVLECAFEYPEGG